MPRQQLLCVSLAVLLRAPLIAAQPCASPQPSPPAWRQ